MPDSKSLAVTTAGLSAFGVFGSLVQLDEMLIEWFPFMEPYMETIEGAFLVSLGVVSIGFFLSLWSTIRGTRLEDLGLFKRRLQHYRCEDMRADDLETVMTIYNDTTPGKTTMDITRVIYGKCRSGWKKVVDSRNDKIVGYFIVLPLTKNGEEAIKDRSFGFHSVNAESFFRSKHAANCSAYIGMIGTEKGLKDAKAFAINRLRHFVNSNSYGRIYARAATGDGLRLLKKQGFNPVFDEDRPELDVMFVKTR